MVGHKPLHELIRKRGLFSKTIIIDTDQVVMNTNSYKKSLSLLNKKSYLTTFENLVHKANKEGHLLYASPVVMGEPLIYFFTYEHKVIKSIIDDIQKDLYQLKPYQLVKIQQDEKVRDIYISCWKDRIVLMTLQSIISKQMEKDYIENLYSFRKGRGQLTALDNFIEAIDKNRKKGNDIFILKRDVKSYGDTIDQNVLKKVLEKRLRSSEKELQINWLMKAVKNDYYLEKGSDIKASLCVGIPSGSPIVPVVENIYLMDLDEKLIELCDWYGRYGDDFICLCSNIDQAQKVDQEIKNVMKFLNLTIAPNKEVDIFLSNQTHLSNIGKYKVQEHVDWLGCEINYKGKLAHKYKHKKEILTNFKKRFNSYLSVIDLPGLKKEVKNDCIQAFISKYLDLQGHQNLQKVIVGKTDPTELKTLDQSIRTAIFKSLRTFYKTKKKNTWKIFRKINIPSLNYQRRNHK